MPGKYDPNSRQTPRLERRVVPLEAPKPFRAMTDEEWYASDEYKLRRQQSLKRGKK